MNDSEFISIFLEEAIEILEKWEFICLNLEKKPTPEGIKDLFRLAHNLKGSSRSVNLLEYGAFVHQIEDLITQIQSNSKSLDHKVIEILFEVQNILVEWTKILTTNSSFVPDLNNIKKQLQSYTENKIINNHDIEYDIFHKNNIEESFGIFSETNPVSNIKQPEQNTILSEQKNQSNKEDSIRISLKKIDQIISQIGELSIQQAIIKNASNSEALTRSNTIEAINLCYKLTQELQNEAMNLRMEPLEKLFQRMERTARDIARSQNKKINVVLEGKSVELDKKIIEKMTDPLTHILRNAVDHGIESVERRRELNKQETATIKISGIQNTSNIEIHISDDGSGINEEIIYKKAIEKGLIKNNVTLNKSEILNLIFLPNFSTAEKITDISGRGVGMDVVKKSLDELCGTITIETEINKGTNFKISLPSSVSILDAVIITVSGNQYALPIHEIEEVINLQDIKIETTTQKGRIINLRGNIIPIEKLSEYIPTNNKHENFNKIAFISRNENKSIAFEIDSISGQQSIVVRQSLGNISKIPGFSGNTILANGEPAMIIKVNELVKSYLQQVHKEQR